MGPNQGGTSLKAIIAMFTLSAVAFGSSSLTLTDISTPGSPLVLTGNVRVIDEAKSELARFSYAAKVTVKNESSKVVLLSVIEMRIRGTNGTEVTSTETDDYFFTSDTLDPGATKLIHDILRPIYSKNEGESRALPKARASVKFVQFLDGTTWGAPDGDNGSLRERSQTWKTLEALAHTHKTSGEQAFLDELMAPSELQTVCYLQRLYLRSKDCKAVLAEVESMLLNARLHAAGAVNVN